MGKNLQIYFSCLFNCNNRGKVVRYIGVSILHAIDIACITLK